jgi:hypothetical protein
MAANEADVTSPGRFGTINDAEMKTFMENVDTKTQKELLLQP